MLLLLVLTAFVQVQSECANACNGHGKCTTFDMCICHRNYQGSDCSERVCQFGIAHVDTPKGDLDGSGTISDADHIVIENSATYPYGTSEKFPNMRDSDLNVIADTAHYYMECSNKGLCDRSTGECSCYEGYDGVACQRASCPGFPDSCSGHGVCKTIGQLAGADNENVYKLWDQSSTMGCECDAGFYGADCSLKKCKYGSDPLYLDDTATTKTAAFDFFVLSTMNHTATLDELTNLFDDGMVSFQDGHWRIRFYDHFGEDWTTSALVDSASCADIVSALEALPNDVVPKGTTYCKRTEILRNSSLEIGEFGSGVGLEWQDAKYDASYTGMSDHIRYNKVKFFSFEQSTPDGSGWPASAAVLPGSLSSSYSTPTAAAGTLSHFYISGFGYQVIFAGIPGYIKEPKIELYTDGKRPSLTTKTDTRPNKYTVGKTITKVFTDGMQGEDKDYFADHCDGVTTTIDTTNNRFAGLDAAEVNLLKACLGDSDFDITNNVDINNWDYGSSEYPHIVKLVKTMTSSSDGGYYVAIYYDVANTAFQMINPFEPMDWEVTGETDSFDVYTTTGTLALTSNYSQVMYSFADQYIYSYNLTVDTDTSRTYDGDLSCEIGDNNADKMNYIGHCLNKTDIITMLNFAEPAKNPPYINLYTVQHLQKKPYMYTLETLMKGGATSSIYDLTGTLTDNTLKSKTSPADYMTNEIKLDLSTNWAVGGGRIPVGGIGQNRDYHAVYKFFPATTSTYEYVAECSNRGTCDTDTGLCACFPGYTGDSCNMQALVSC